MGTPQPSFEVTPLRNSNVQFLYSRRHEIDMDPPYQRQGEVWTIERQQLLIDTLLNEFDVPKIYLHQHSSPERKGERTYRYALVDGKQRLNAIFRFLDGKLPLSDDFIHMTTGSNEASGATFENLKKINPLLASDLQATALDVMTIRTDDVEMIEEMFSRLNEAVPLNASEKRNARGGPLPKMVRDLVSHTFFTDCLPFTNRRYRHYDLASKFLYWADGYGGVGETLVRDVKKRRLDKFFTDAKNSEWDDGHIDQLVDTTTQTLNHLDGIFTKEDNLLRNVGMISLYYLLTHKRRIAGDSPLLRTDLTDFEEERRGASNRSENEIDYADLVYAEFARHAQSPNDGGALARRLEIIETWLHARREGISARTAVGSLYQK